APAADAGAAKPVEQLRPRAQGLNETTHIADAKAFIGWAGPAIVGCEESEDRHTRLLHGRPDRVSYVGRRARSRRSSRFFPWRRASDRYAEQSASASREDQGTVPRRDCGK